MQEYFFDKITQAKWSLLNFHSSRFDLGKIQHIINKSQQS